MVAILLITCQSQIYGNTAFLIGHGQCICMKFADALWSWTWSKLEETKRRHFTEQRADPVAIAFAQTRAVI